MRSEIPDLSEKPNHQIISEFSSLGTISEATIRLWLTLRQAMKIPFQPERMDDDWLRFRINSNTFLWLGSNCVQNQIRDEISFHKVNACRYFISTETRVPSGIE